jgi:hypothetical protein
MGRAYGCHAAVANIESLPDRQERRKLQGEEERGRRGAEKAGRSGFIRRCLEPVVERMVRRDVEERTERGDKSSVPCPLGAQDGVGGVFD